MPKSCLILNQYEYIWVDSSKLMASTNMQAWTMLKVAPILPFYKGNEYRRLKNNLFTVCTVCLLPCNSKNIAQSPPSCPRIIRSGNCGLGVKMAEGSAVYDCHQLATKRLPACQRRVSRSPKVHPQLRPLGEFFLCPSAETVKISPRPIPTDNRGNT